ncbi:MAG: methyltransferase domain-containing protein [Geobacteraceae bacterium]|nr:methyltransferase domain-containing protein [Geobacteraceae bacterium]
MAKIAPFDEQAVKYDAWFDKHVGLYQAELKALRALVPAGERGVEIGVGTGRFAAPLGVAIGVEPSPGMAELARQRGVEVLEGVAEELPLPDGAFDFALMVTVVCFLDDVAKAFREVCRILKPNGTMVIGFIDRESKLGQQYSQKKEQSQFYRDAIFYSVSELVVLLTKAGFSDFAYRQTLFQEESTNLTVKEGYGNGGFVVIRAYKSEGGRYK